jgi:hypothetical protein
VRSLLIALVIGAVVLMPMVTMFKLPWAIGLWRKLKLLLLIYALVILASAIAGLILRWDEIYG